MPKLEQVVRNLAFEDYHPQSLLNASGHYELPLNPSFPLAVKLFHYRQQVFPLHWHERLEVAVLIEGEGFFRVGDRRWSCSAGDVVVVDTLRLHTFEDFQSKQNRAVVITFLPSLVCNLGSPAEDYTFLTPFYCQVQASTPVVRSSDEAWTPVHSALARLVQSQFEREPYHNAESKVALLETLYHLARHFRAAQVEEHELNSQRQRAARLGKLIEYVQQHYAERMSVDDASGVVAMSRSRFTHFFRRAAGISFVSYLTNVRLNQAARLLRDDHMTVAEVAAAVGFTDQSYFDRRFKQHFGESPRQHRMKLCVTDRACLSNKSD